MAICMSKGRPSPILVADPDPAYHRTHGGASHARDDRRRLAHRASARRGACRGHGARIHEAADRDGPGGDVRPLRARRRGWRRDDAAIPGRQVRVRRPDQSADRHPAQELHQGGFLLPRPRRTPLHPHPAVLLRRHRRRGAGFRSSARGHGARRAGGSARRLLPGGCALGRARAGGSPRAELEGREAAGTGVARRAERGDGADGPYTKGTCPRSSSATVPGSRPTRSRSSRRWRSRRAHRSSSSAMRGRWCTSTTGSTIC